MSAASGSHQLTLAPSFYSRQATSALPARPLRSQSPATPAALRTTFRESALREDLLAASAVLLAAVLATTVVSQATRPETVVLPQAVVSAAASAVHPRLATTAAALATLAASAPLPAVLPHQGTATTVDSQDTFRESAASHSKSLATAAALPTT